MSVRIEVIAQTINDVYDGVNRSKIGPIEFVKEDGSKALNNIPYQAFLQILANCIPKQMEGTIDGSVETR